MSDAGLDRAGITPQGGRVKLSKIVVYFLLGFVAIFVVAELSVRIFGSVPLHPDKSFIFENEIPGMARDVRYEIDGDGIRWRESKGAAKYRILCIGGLGTTGMLQNVDDTWWGKLVVILEEELGGPVEIGCIVGAGQTGIYAGSKWLDSALEQVDGVDLVISVFGHTDALDPRIDTKFDPGAIEGPKQPGGFKFTLAKISHLARKIRNGRKQSERNKLQSKLGQPNHLRDSINGSRQVYLDEKKITSDPMRENEAVTAYAAGVDAMIESAKRHNAKLVVAGEPTIFSSLISPDAATALHTLVHVGPGPDDFAKPEPTWVEDELNSFYATASRQCAAAGVPFINLQKVISQTRENFLTEAILTDAGAEEVARNLAPLVSQSLK